MNRDAARSLLSELVAEGEQLLRDTGPRTDPAADKVEVWRATVMEILAVLLPTDSTLISLFRNGSSDQETSRGAQLERDLQVLRDAQRVSKLHEEERSALVEGEYASAVERELRLLIGSILPRTPWFAVPMLALLGAIGFALYGSFRIQDLNVDVRAMADSAVMRARSEISSVSSDAQAAVREAERQANGVLADARGALSQRMEERLVDHIESEEARITLAATDRIRSLEGAPILDSLSGRVQRLGGMTSDVLADIARADSTLQELSGEVAILRSSLDSIADRGDREAIAALAQAPRVPSWFMPVVALVVLLSVAFSLMAYRRSAKARAS